MLTKLATAAPPIFITPASLAPGICMPPARPVTCIAASTCIDTPVAPIGWPLALSPPDGLTGSRPSFSVQPSRIARAPAPLGVSPIASYSINSAIVKQSWVSTRSRSSSLRPAAARARCQASAGPSNATTSRRLIGRKSLTCSAARKTTALGMRRRRDVGQHESGRPIGNQRAIGALERAGNDRVLVGNRAAELVAKILLHLCQGIGDAVLVVFGGDPRQGVGLVAVALEIALRDLPENAGKTTFDGVFFLAIAGAEQNVADPGARHLAHLFDPDDQDKARPAGGDRVQSLVDCRRTGGAGVLDPGCGLEAEAGIGLKHQRGRKLLADKPAIHGPDINRIDIRGADPGIGERRLGHLDDQ